MLVSEMENVISLSVPLTACVIMEKLPALRPLDEQVRHNR